MPFPVLPDIAARPQAAQSSQEVPAGVRCVSTQEETELNILNGRYKYDARKWNCVSKSSFDFVSKLLQRDPDMRMTAEEALAHPWIVEREQMACGTESTGLDASVVRSLAEYSKASKFRRTCMQVMAWSLNNGEMAEVREAFMELDVQKTGAIQLHQLKSVLEERFNICDDETRKIFEALDSSNNEEVGYSEFLAAMMSSRIQVHEDLVRAAFQPYDQDDSGFISVENLRQVLTESLDSQEMAEDLLKGVPWVGPDRRVSFDEFIEYLTGGEAEESHKRAVGFVIDKQMSRMSSSELMRMAPTLRHCPLTPKSLNRAKSTPFMMVEDSDEEAKMEIPMAPFLTAPNPAKQVKVPSDLVLDTAEATATANPKHLDEVPESPPATGQTPAANSKGAIRLLDIVFHTNGRFGFGKGKTRLRAARAEASSLSQRLAAGSEALAHSQKQVNELTARARVIADERTRMEESLQATHQRELTALKEEHARAMSALQCSATEEKSRLEAEHKQALQAALDRAQRAEGSVEELQRARQSLTVTGESCRERLELAERQLMEASQETCELRKQLKQLEELKFRHERELSGLQVQLASMKEQLVVREESLDQSIEKAERERRSPRATAFESSSLVRPLMVPTLETAETVVSIKYLSSLQEAPPMAQSMQLQAIEGRLQKALERVRLVLSAEKTPQLAANVHHQYGDKYFLVERGTCIAAASQMNCLAAMGLTADQLRSLHAWLPGQVSLRFRSQEKCTFDREEKREEENPRKHVEELSVGGVARASWSSKVVTTITEYFWKFESTYTLEAFRGVGAEDADRLLLLSRSGQVELKTSAKSPPPHPESRVPATNQEVNITWLLQLLSQDGESPLFKIDRAAAGCSTPRRNQDVDKAFAHFTMFANWANGVSDYLNHLSSVDPRMSPQLQVDAVFAPILPLMVKGQSSESSSARAEMLASLCPSTDMPDSLIMSVSDANRLLTEEVRTIKEQQANICECLPGADGIYTNTEGSIHLILRHCENVAKRWSELVEYAEAMLRKQLMDAIGKEVTPALFASYMRFHYRKLFRQEFQPRQFCFAVRRSEHHSPEGTISIEEDTVGLDEASIRSPIVTIANSASTPCPMTFPLNASTEVSFTGDVHLHGWLSHRFSGASGVSLYLTSRARQFSSMLVLVGRVASATSFDPKFAAILQNKDELTIPLELSMIPTPKEFKDAIASLSPQQQAFAKAFRSMQLESTLFGILVVQIKPQLEKLLNLPDDSLTKEIKLTQDLMDLFIKYQIPSDLLSFSDESATGDSPALPAKRLEMVKRHVKAMHDMIQQEKEAEVMAARQEAQYSQPLHFARSDSDLSMEERRCSSPLSECEEAEDDCDSECRSAGLSSPVKAFGSAMPVAAAAPPAMLKKCKVTEKCEERVRDRDDRSATSANPAKPSSSQPGQPAEPSEAFGKAGGPGSGVQIARDYTKVPKQMDAQFESLAPDSALRPTIINPGVCWTKRAQKALLAQPSESSLFHDEQKREKDAAFDLLDAITKSGALPLSHAALHIVIAATHCFDKTVTETVVQDNVNPIDKVERSSLIVASTVHQQPVAALIDEASAARISTSSPQLFLQDA
ncbi:CPK5 [Symbiodinium pilosum]|uniref:CPK5 protein n=1 Tax=Symbiodinium pilosum TaxID=2952 RepID=A0A812XD29_SYMPI|nr:CPK5 [Symbiodinium pilosum]